MSSTADIQVRIDEALRLLGEMYEHDPRHQITEIHLQNLEREYAVAAAEEWREHQAANVAKLAKITGGM